MAVISSAERQKSRATEIHPLLLLGLADGNTFRSGSTAHRPLELSGPVLEVDPSLQLDTTCRRLPNPYATSARPAERRAERIPPLSVLVPAISTIAGPLTQAMPSIQVELTLSGSARVGSLLFKSQADLPSKSLAEEIQPGALLPPMIGGS